MGNFHHSCIFLSSLCSQLSTFYLFYTESRWPVVPSIPSSFPASYSPFCEVYMIEKHDKELERNLLLLFCLKSCLILLRNGLQHARLPSPPPSPGVCSSSCLLSQYCFLLLVVIDPVMNSLNTVWTTIKYCGLVWRLVWTSTSTMLSQAGWYRSP